MQGEAAGWQEAEGGWRVPIGSREIQHVLRVGEARTAGGVETCEVEFSWRWVPRGVGEAFDKRGAVVASLPDRAREAAVRLNWSSGVAYRAVARLERRAGGDWRVAEIGKSKNFDEKTQQSAF